MKLHSYNEYLEQVINDEITLTREAIVEIISTLYKSSCLNTKQLVDKFLPNDIENDEQIKAILMTLTDHHLEAILLNLK